MDEDEMISRGMEVFEECYQGVVPMPAVNAREFSGMTMKMFNDFWGDGRLSFREKRLIVRVLIRHSSRRTPNQHCVMAR
jgi:hypothetical protein